MTSLNANPTRLRIAMSSYYLPSESKMGVGYQAHALANALADRGHDVTVVSACAGSDGARYRTETVPLEGSMRTFRFALQLRHVDWTSFDVFHAHNGDYLLWGTKARPHVRTVHGSSLREALHATNTRDRLVMAYFAACETLATKVADESVAVSRNTQRWLPWVKTVIPNGVDLHRLRPGTKTEHPSVLFVGTYLQRKRGKLLTERFAEDVLPRFPDAELWMVSEDAPDAPQTRVFGRISDEELAALYRRAWVFCLPSSYEGFGIPYIEAMASGTAILATPNAGAIEVTEAGRYAVIVREAALGGALVRLLESSDERERLSVGGLTHVRQFDLAEVAARYERVYRRLLEQSTQH